MHHRTALAEPYIPITKPRSGPEAPGALNSYLNLPSYMHTECVRNPRNVAFSQKYIESLLLSFVERDS